MRIRNILSSILPGHKRRCQWARERLELLLDDDRQSDPVEEVESLALACIMARLHQRVVASLRREYYAIGGLGMPGHLAILKDSGFPLHCDIYEREIARWESDVEWCADTFGEDRVAFRHDCMNIDKLRDEQGLLPPRGR